MAETLIIRDPKQFGERLWNLKNRRKFCDATVSNGSRRISVHKVVLASASQFFERKFTSKETSSKKGICTVVDMEVMQSLLEFCYRGYFIVSEINAMSAYQIANYLEINSIVENCTKILTRRINSKNCLLTWKMVKICEHQDLENHIIQIVRENIDEISQTEEYLSLDYFELKKVFSSKANVKSEKSLYEAMKMWINHNNSSRKRHLNELLDYVNLKCMARDTYISEAESICGSNSDCWKKFLEAATLQRNFSDCPSSSNTIVVIGDSDSNNSKVLEIFDLNSKKWVEILHEECFKTNFAAKFVHGKIMIIGGFSENKSVNTVEYYDLETGRTELLPRMKYARNSMSAVNYENNVFVFGGFDNNELSSVEKWSPDTRKWQEVASMSSPRVGMGVAVLDNEIFVVGGKSGRILSITEAYNPATNEWRKCGDLIEKKQHIGLAAVNGFLYAVGGMAKFCLSTVEKYDKTIDKWTMVRYLDISRCTIAAMDFNGRLVITGGSSTEGVGPWVEMYDEKDDTWTTLPSMNVGRTFHNAVQVPWSLAEVALARIAS